MRRVWVAIAVDWWRCRGDLCGRPVPRLPIRPGQAARKRATTGVAPHIANSPSTNLVQDKGIRGNGHMVMIEKNNLDIARTIDEWAVKNVK